jgi:hypothetical protein
MLSAFVRQRLTMYISRHRQADLDTLRQLTGTGAPAFVQRESGQILCLR